MKRPPKEKPRHEPKADGATQMTALSKKSIDKGLHPSENAMFYTPAASANDATGITPTLPEDIAAAKSYEQLYPLPVTAPENAPKDELPDRLHEGKSRMRGEFPVKYE